MWRTISRESWSRTLAELHTSTSGLVVPVHLSKSDMNDEPDASGQIGDDGHGEVARVARVTDPVGEHLDEPACFDDGGSTVVVVLKVVPRGRVQRAALRERPGNDALLDDVAVRERERPPSAERLDGTMLAAFKTMLTQSR